MKGWSIKAKIDFNKKNKKRMKSILFIVFVSTLLGSCSSNSKQVDASGNFESNATIISAENTGRLTYYNITDGMMVDSNKLVAIIDTTQLFLSKEQLKASISSIKAQSKSVLSQINVLKEQQKVLLSNFDRTKKMYADGSATKKQLDDLQGKINVNKEQIQNIKSKNTSVLSKYKALDIQIRQVEDRLQKSVIKNPVSGTVLVSYVKENEFVNAGRPLYLIQNLTELKLKAFITEPQLSQIKIGQKVTVGIDGKDGEKTISGIVSWVSSQSEFTPKIIQTKDERQNLVYAIKIDVKNDGSLKIGMPASVYF